MSNIFEDVLNDANDVEARLLGPNYDYVGKINTPGDLGVSSDGNLTALGNDINALIAYTEVLVTGKGKGSKTGGPLGDKFYLSTGQKCRDVDTGDEVPRSVYINNVPDGSIPFITTALNGEKFTTFEGLIPGMMEDIAQISPYEMMQSFLSGSVPDCQITNYEVRVDPNNPNTQTSGYITLTDINNLKENFETIGSSYPFSPSKKPKWYSSYYRKKPIALPNDMVMQSFFMGLSVIGLYILFQLMKK